VPASPDSPVGADSVREGVRGVLAEVPPKCRVGARMRVPRAESVLAIVRS
jgi:hypothetical protein